MNNCEKMIFLNLLFHFPYIALKHELRKKANVIAKENYCKQQNIKTAELRIRLNIAKNCR